MNYKLKELLIYNVHIIIIHLNAGFGGIFQPI